VTSSVECAIGRPVPHATLNSAPIKIGESKKSFGIMIAI